MNNELSTTIKFIRLPLAVLVIFVHCSPAAFEGYNIGLGATSFQCVFNAIVDFMTFVANCAVPSFFLISGYLFFYNVESLNWDVYKRKIFSRCTSLLLPFLFWNLAVFIWGLVIVIVNAYKNHCDIYEQLSMELASVSIRDLFVSYKNTGVPCYMIMWYVRDLIFLSVISPVFYVLAKYAKFIYPIIAVSLYLFTCFHWHWLQERSIFFWGIGCWLAINKYDVYKCLISIHAKILSSIVVIVCMAYVLSSNEIVWIDRLIGIGVVFSFFVGAVVCIHKNIMSFFLAYSTSTMFVYCTHILQPANKCTIAAGVTCLLYEILGWMPFIGPIVCYLCTPIVTALICIFVFKLLMRYFPKFTCVISGIKYTPHN